jgi:TRAP-type transport system periplasmic protein
MKLRAMVLICGAIVFYLLGVGTAESKDKKTFRWNYLALVPASHPYGKIANKQFKDLEKRSKGRLKISWISWGQSPYKPFDALTVLRDGLVQCSGVCAPMVGGNAPALAAPNLPYILPKLETDLEKFYALSTNSLWMNPKVNMAAAKVWNDFGIIPLGIHYWGNQNYYTRIPVKKPADFKGLKIRCYASDDTDMLKALGAVGVVIAAPEVYTALQRGVMDGVMTQAQSMLGLHWGEVLKYAYIMSSKNTTNFFAVSKKAWYSLPGDLQDLLKETGYNITKEIVAWSIKDKPKTLKILKDKYDWTITPGSESDYQYMRNLAKKEVWPKWIDRAGPEAKDMLNTCLEALGDPDRF